MDIVEACKASIQKQLVDLDKYIDTQRNTESSEDEFLQTQTMIEAVIADKDKNLDRILDQQAHIKMIIERDGRIKSLRKLIIEDTRVIDMLRKNCARIGLNALKDRQEQLETQAKNLERFQMQQLQSIADDYRRHQEILEQRKKEIIDLNRETENEEKNRASYLADVEKNLEKQLQNRQQMGNGGLTGCSVGRGLNDELHNPDYIELISIDEYAPYGAAPHSRIGTNSARGGSGGGRRTRRGAANSSNKP